MSQFLDSEAEESEVSIVFKPYITYFLLKLLNLIGYPSTFIYFIKSFYILMYHPGLDTV